MLLMDQDKIILIPHIDFVIPKEFTDVMECKASLFSVLPKVPEQLSLEKEFTKEEVFQVLREMEGDKAPGLYGFTMAFFHKCWSVVEKKVMDFFVYFHRHYVFERSMNASFLYLIPKKCNAINIKDFLPHQLGG